MTEDEQLLEEYTKEIFGNLSSNMTVASLIERHRHLRQKNVEWTKAYNEEREKGYNAGYEFGVKNAAENAIMLEDLRKMTLQEISNLIGTDD
jgi:hypothetical protein